MEIIPAIDLLAGRCVRLYQGDFDKVTHYEARPLDLARRYHAAGLRRLHVVDLDGARDGVPGNLETIRQLAAESGMTVQAGGGIRSRDGVRALTAAGVDRVVVGSVAVAKPDEVSGWLREAGPERIVLAFDVRMHEPSGEPVVSIHGWQKASGRVLWELVEFYLVLGARHYLCTDIGKDGTLTGPNTGLYRECVRRYPEARFIASGGLSSAADLPELASTGVASVVTGKALLDGRLSLEEIRKFSRDA